jgi:hypothetical protein
MKRLEKQLAGRVLQLFLPDLVPAATFQLMQLS